MRWLRPPLSLALFLLCASPGGLAAAQSVKLTSPDGQAVVAGTLLSFDGKTFQVLTSIGALSMPAEGVTCEGDGCPATGAGPSSIRVAGDGSVVRGALPELVDAYSLAIDTDIERARGASGDLVFRMSSYSGQPVLDVELADIGADAAFDDLIDGRASLAVTTRPITADEATRLTGRDPSAVHQLRLETVIGIDALVPVAAPGAGIRAISVSDLAAIYSGNITNWSQLGGPDLAISAFLREPGSDLRAAFERLVMAPAGQAVAAHVISLDSDEALANAVSMFPNAIGITTASAAPEDAILSVRDRCGREISPNLFNIKAEIYPLLTRLHIYDSPAEELPHVRGLIDFALSEPGQQLVQDTGFIDILPIQEDRAQRDPALLALANSADVDEDRLILLERYRLITAESERLSSTFRIGSGQTLDGRGEADLRQLAQRILAGGFDGKELIFIGHSGRMEELFNARRQSLADARWLLDRLVREFPGIEEFIEVGFRPLGYGDVTAVDCMGGPVDGNNPRLVEVWVRPLAGG